MTNSSWQTARHRIVVPINDYTPGCGGECRAMGVKCSSVRLLLPLRRPRILPLCVLAFVSLASFVARAQQVPVFHGGVDLVNLAATVTDKRGNLVTDLTAADFEILE